MTTTPKSDAQLVEELVTLLAPRRMGDGWYLGSRQPGGRGRVYGGQVVAQALAAAQDTVEAGRIAHSLHAYFLRAGSEDHEITYKVERDFDGGSFSNRRIIALQQDKPIFNMVASFHKLAEGLSHQIAMPDVPAPEALVDELVLRARFAETLPEERRAFFMRKRPIEYRPCEPDGMFSDTPQLPAVRNIWFRLRGSIGDDAGMHRAILAHASDSWLLGTCMMPHGEFWDKPGFTSASLDHAVWLHDDFRVDDWLLYACDSPWSGRDRGFNRGSIFARDGRLIASCTQEGLIRYRAV